jgi:hypothetical protein
VESGGYRRWGNTHDPHNHRGVSARAWAAIELGAVAGIDTDGASELTPVEGWAQHG